MVEKEDVLVLKPSENAVDYALETALQKVNHLYKGETRLLSERYDSLYKGDLARNVVMDWLDQNMKKDSVLHSFTDSDKSKDPSKPDFGWDIMHTVHDKSDYSGLNAYFIEVKSYSLPMINGRKKLEEILEKYDVIVPVKNRNGKIIVPGENCATETFVQTFHNRFEMKKNINEEKLKKKLNELNSKKQKEFLHEFLSVGKRYSRVIVAGWLFGKDVARIAKEFNPQTRKYGEKEFWRAPLTKARPMKEYLSLA